ncbi:hypothetical protein RAB80_010907 [Fusarium oxysporum f. sp. vasinfectum]|nr:hypothetical protein RAB80_010907 [Fusarium oxysporum f. sp. vasinfectum]KAK2929779.1 hypothetical protein FoTM2_010119 [Fusarium oxysporum f. sp. vasinfectum]
MSVTNPFIEFEKDLDVRIAETGVKWNHKKDNLASSLDRFYEKECLKEPSKFPKMALNVMQALKKTAHSSLDDLLEWVYATQRSQDDESKRQIKDLVQCIDDYYQSQKSRIESERRLTEQRLLVMEKSRPPNPASSPEQKKPIQKRVTSALNRVGSAGKAFERAKATERIIRSQQANGQPRPSRHPRHRHRRENAIRTEKTLNRLNENAAISRKTSLYKRSQNYGSPKGLAHRTSMTAPRLPTAIRPQKRYTASSLSQEFNASELQRDEPDDVPDKIYAKPSLEQELVAAQGHGHPRIDKELLIDDAFVLGQQLNEEFSTISSPADAEDSDGGDTEVEEMAEEGKEQQKRVGDTPLREAEDETKEHDELNDKLEIKNGGVEHQTAHLQEKPQSGPDGTIMLSPKMAIKLWKILLENNERVDFAISKCENLEKCDINESSMKELIDIWVPAIKDHHCKFKKIKSFFADIARHVLDIDLPPNAAQTSEASNSMSGYSETSAGMESSQCLSTAPSSVSRDSFLSNKDHDGDDLEVNASSEPKRPVFPDSESAASLRPGCSRELSAWQQKIKKNRESVSRGPYLSPPSSAGTQYYTTPQSSPRDGDSTKKWWISPKEENTPQKDSDDEKEVVSEDEKGNSPARDMSSNGTGESSDIPEASQEANTPAPGNSDGGDDPDPDPTKGTTVDNESSHPLAQSSTKDSAQKHNLSTQSETSNSAEMSSKLIPSDPDHVMVIRNVTPNIATFSVPFSRFGKVKIGGRGTLVKLTSGGLAIFSPVALTKATQAKVMEMGGDVRYIVALDYEHHIFISEWKKEYPSAKIIGPEGLPEKRAKQTDDPKINDDEFAVVFKKENKREIKIDPDFDADFDYEYVDGHANLEIVFFYKPEQVLIQADLLFNLPPTEQYSKVPESELPADGAVGKLFACVQNPRGDTKWLQRFNWYLLAKNRESFNDSMAQIAKWDFHTMIPCHGDVLEGDGKEVFMKVFDWHLQGHK